MTDWTSHIISVQYQEIMMTSKDSKLRKIYEFDSISVQKLGNYDNI